MRQAAGALAMAAVVAIAGSAVDAGAWTKRMGNPQNTNDVGDDPVLTSSSVKDLKVSRLLPTTGVVNATPVVSDDLLFVGDGGATGGFFYVFDLRTSALLVKLFTNATVSTPLVGNGVQSTALVATVTNPGVGEERRVYFGANVKPESLWCLSVSGILAKRSDLNTNGPSDGQEFLCDGADWPIIIAGSGNVQTNTLDLPLPVYNSSPIFSQDQRVVDASGAIRTADVVYTATIGADCSDGQLWAIDAYSAELYWIYDPVPNFQNLTQETTAQAPVSLGNGGVIWTVPAQSADGEYLYVTTGDCVEQPQVGFQAESLVALDPGTGNVQWYHQRRLVDVSDYDIGNSPVVVDVPGEDGCNVVVSTDKNGCVYGFPQKGSIPQVGEPDYDPTRPGQQRVLWRTCFVPGSLGGGFNASGASVHGRTVLAQASGTGGRVPGDNVNAFALDACTGEYHWSTSAIQSGAAEGAIASGIWFQPSGATLQAFEAGPAKNHLATVALVNPATTAPVQSTPGGGGPAIVDGTIYVPTRSGIAVIEVASGSNASPPALSTNDSFGGPYPLPVGTGVEQVMMPVDPYDPYSPPAGPVETWPGMNP